ncbi:MAG: glutaminyl-peptide cyclotransferase [Halioglobus sp.]
MRTTPVIACLLALLVNSVPAIAVELFTYEVVTTKPQDRSLFTQGLQIIDGQLYVGTGQYGESRLLRYDWPNMTVNHEHPLDPRLFGEGVTVLDDRVYQLTWRSGLLFTYQRDTLEMLEVSRIPTQGWGLTHDGQNLILSDGSNRLYFVDPKEQRLTRSLYVTQEGLPVTRLNELEWIEGKIWANVYQTDRIVIIDPDNGNITGSIDLMGLLPAIERLPDTDVLNGIAYEQDSGKVWVTGKRWPYLYQIKLISLANADETRIDAKTR